MKGGDPSHNGFAHGHHETRDGHRLSAELIAKAKPGIVRRDPGSSST